MKTITVQRCRECNGAIHLKNGCHCPKLPVTIRFHYKTKTQRLLDIKDYHFVAQKVVDGFEYRLFRTKVGLLLDCLTDVKLSLKQDEKGFNDLLEKFLAVKDY